MQLRINQLIARRKILHKFPGQKLIVKIVIWLTAEILLSFLGLDDLADYSEFIYEKPTIILIG